LPTGKRGLLIGQLRLEGIVRLDTTNAMIAVVDNNSNRAYFLRENDAVYNGIVSKITPDSVIFKENALDQNGRLVVREVVKRLSPGPGEGR
jgi:type II secretory pathway component PulC